MIVPNDFIIVLVQNHLYQKSTLFSYNLEQLVKGIALFGLINFYSDNET